MRFVVAVLAFIGVAIATWIAVMAGYVIFTTVTGFFDREGAAAMGFAFTIGPFCALIAGTLAAILVLRRYRRKAG